MERFQWFPLRCRPLHCHYRTFHYTMSAREVHKHRVVPDPLSHTWMGELSSSLLLQYVHFGGEAAFDKKPFFKSFWGVFFDVRVTQKWRLDEAGEHLAFILQLCFKKKKFNLTVRSMYEYVLWWHEDELRHLQYVSKPDVCWWALWSLVTFVMAVTWYYKPK